MLTESNGVDNDIIGFYIPKGKYEEIDSVLSLTYDNYFQISFNKDLSSNGMTRSNYKDFVEMMDRTFILENWNEIEIRECSQQDSQASVSPLLVRIMASLFLQLGRRIGNWHFKQLK